jgi:hypothetical protein
VPAVFMHNNSSVATVNDLEIELDRKYNFVTPVYVSFCHYLSRSENLTALCYLPMLFVCRSLDFFLALFISLTLLWRLSSIESSKYKSFKATWSTAGEMSFDTLGQAQIIN